MNIALILSGGIGSRMETDIPKQYIEVAGKPIVSYCIKTMSECDKIDAIQIVADEKWQSKFEKWLQTSDVKHKFRGFSTPGDSRQLSIYNGLNDVIKYAQEDDVVVIHDAARPLLSKRMIEDCFSALTVYDGVIPVLRMKDTVYMSEDGKRISSLLNRSKIFAGQAPECFLLGKYLKANERLMPEQIKMISGSTEPAIMARLNVVMIHGDENNFKITTKADLERFRHIVEERIE